MTVRGLLVFVFCITAPGCTRTLYYWGRYERSLLLMYRDTEDFNLTKEIELLKKDIDRAERKKYRVPPGVHAHLGYLYYLAGEDVAAKTHFELEKELFPESATLMNRLLEGV